MRYSHPIKGIMRPEFSLNVEFMIFHLNVSLSTIKSSQSKWLTPHRDVCTKNAFNRWITNLNCGPISSCQSFYHHCMSVCHWKECSDSGNIIQAQQVLCVAVAYTTECNDTAKGTILQTPQSRSTIWGVKFKSTVSGTMIVKGTEKIASESTS